MKRLIAILFVVLLFTSFAVSSMALEIDDGKIIVATKDEAKYFGTEITSGCTKYVAANGSDLCYYDMSGDKDMDICDLVVLVRSQIDFDTSGTYDSSDEIAFREILLSQENI